MIILDTNVLSELMRVNAEPFVLDWLENQAIESVWTTSVAVYEIRAGIEFLADGRRRSTLQSAFDKVLNEDLNGRVLDFDTVAAHTSGSIAGVQRRAGRPVDIRDVQIAGIALARKASLVTRNTKHFEGLGLKLINPWSA